MSPAGLLGSGPTRGRTASVVFSAVVAALASLPGTAVAQALTGAGPSLPIPANAVEPLREVRTIQIVGQGFTGSWGVVAPPPTHVAQPGWNGSFTAIGPVPSGNTAVGSTQYSFATMPAGVLPADTFFYLFDVDSPGGSPNEAITLRAYDGLGNALTVPWLQQPEYTNGTNPNHMPAWSWDGIDYVFTSAPSDPTGIFVLLTNNRDIAALDVTRTRTTAWFQLHAPFYDAFDDNSVAWTKSAENTTGSAVDGVEIIVDEVVGTGGVEGSSSVFPDFSVSHTATTTIFRWTGATLQPGETASVTVYYPSIDLADLVSATWLIGASATGCIPQVSVTSFAALTVTNNVLCNEERTLHVGGIFAEYYSGSPPTPPSLVDGAARFPDASEPLPGTIALAGGESALLPGFANAPPGTTFALVIFDVSADAGFAEATRDFVLVPVVTPVPAMSAGARLGAALLLALCVPVLFRRAMESSLLREA